MDSRYVPVLDTDLESKTYKVYAELHEVVHVYSVFLSACTRGKRVTTRRGDQAYIGTVRIYHVVRKSVLNAIDFVKSGEGDLILASNEPTKLEAM